jgi:5-methylcytosine-specific restriction endonuclease McrA
MKWQPIETPRRQRSHLKLKTCFYCNTVFSISQSAIGDHFPLPKRNGGTNTVPCCKTCHDAKDNLSLYQWNNEMISAVIKDFPRLSTHTRIFLAKAIAVLSDYQNDIMPENNDLSQASIP